MLIETARRLGLCVATLFAASVVIFLVLNALPGDAAAILLGTAARPDTIAALRQQLGLDQTLFLEYGRWLLGLATGDLGTSAAYGVPVSSLVSERAAVTLPLASLAFGLAACAGLPWGVAAGTRPGSDLDRAGFGLAQVGLATPDFWTGLLLILLFSSTLQWLPAGGFPGWSHGPGPALRALLLPAVALAVPQAAVLAQVTRAAVIEATGADFVRSARAKGLSGARVVWRHVIPNALPAIVTVAGLQASFLVSGAVLVENVFNLPGLGRLAAQALAQRDLVVMRNVVLILTVIVIACNLLVDLACLWLDPRTRADR